MLVITSYSYISNSEFETKLHIQFNIDAMILVIIYGSS